MRSLEEHASDDAPSLSALLDRNTQFLRRCIDDGRFVAQPACVFVYRLACSGHVQRGVVAEIPISAYLNGRIKRHEFTRVAREDALAEYIDHVRAASSPAWPRLSGGSGDTGRGWMPRRKPRPTSPTGRRTESRTTSGCSTARMRPRCSPHSTAFRARISPTVTIGARRRPDSRRPVRTYGCWWHSFPTTSSGSCRSTESCATSGRIPPSRSSPASPRTSW